MKVWFRDGFCCVPFALLLTYLTNPGFIKENIDWDEEENSVSFGAVHKLPTGWTSFELSTFC